MLTDLHDIYWLIWTKSKGKHDISHFSVIMCQEIKKNKVKSYTSIFISHHTSKNSSLLVQIRVVGWLILLPLDRAKLAASLRFSNV